MTNTSPIHEHQTSMAQLKQELAELKQTEAVLREREARYRLIVEHQNDLIVTFIPDGVLTYVSPQYCETFGKTEAELLGKKFMPLIHEDDRARVAQSLKNLFVEPYTCAHEERAFTKDGWRWLAWSNRALLNEKGQVIEIVAVGRDITDHKRADEHSFRLEQAIETMHLGVTIADLDGKILYTNSAEARMHGYRVEELIGQDVRMLAPPERRKPVILQEIKDWKGLKRESVNLRKDGSTFPVWLMSEIIKDVNGEPVGIVTSCEDITDRKQAEQEYRTILQTALDGFWIVSHKGDFLDVNDAYCKLIGYTRAELLTMRIPDIEAQETPAETRQHIERIITHGYDRFETQHRCKNGETVDVEVSTQSLEVRGGVFVVFVKDITERKYTENELQQHREHLEELVRERTAELQRANQQLAKEIDERKRVEKALRESEEFNRSIIESSRDCIKVLDMEGRLQFMNLGGQKLLGIEDLSPYVNTRYEDFWEGKDRQAAQHALLQARKGHTGVFQGYSPTVSGTPKWWDVVITRILGAEGTPQRLLVVSRDITERWQVEETLRKLSLAVAQSPATIVITDLDGTIEFVNPAFSKRTGYTREEALGQNPRVLKSGKHPQEFYEKLWRTISHGEVWQGEFINKKKNGELYWESAIISPVKDQHNRITHYLAIKDDITERKQAEEDLKKAKEAADAANRAKSEFLANMSHEIRTPMNAILGFAEILGEKITDAQQRYYLAAILSAGKSLLTLINDILDLSKIEAGKLELEYTAIDPRSVFNEINQIFSQKVAEKELMLTVVLAPNFPNAVMLDETRLRQVLLNLVGNAVKFTEAGSINVSAEARYRDELHQTVDVQFSVADTGIGIPEDQQASIFGAFEQQKGQSKTKYGGTGLGLAITKRLLEMMGGEIVVTSTAGKGSTFTVIIRNVRVAASPEKVVTTSEIRIDGIRFEKATILIADDKPDNRKLLLGYLADYGFNFIEAQDGQEALALTQQHCPDLILMDMKMPVLDGFDATRSMKASPVLKTIPVIAVTAAAMKDAEAAISALCDGYLRKPVKKAELIAELAKFLKHSLESGKPSRFQKPRRFDQRESFPEALAPEMLAKLPELQHILETSFLPRSEELHEMLIMDDVKQFADDLLRLAQTYPLQWLTEYGENLAQQVQHYDVDNIEMLMAEFPKLVEQIKSLSV